MCCVEAALLVSAGHGQQRAGQLSDVGVHLRVSHVVLHRSLPVIRLGISHELTR